VRSTIVKLMPKEGPTWRNCRTQS